LQISVKNDYALHALFDLACARSTEPVKIADIARRQQIPQKFLELILSNLKQGGFVESRRGAEGGYRLARPARTITVGEVLRYLQGRHEGRNGARRRGDSPFASLWEQIDESVATVLDRADLETIAREWIDRRSRFVPNWEI